eukprot:4470638-Ditylum_brightwellii.AAC.1
MEGVNFHIEQEVDVLKIKEYISCMKKILNADISGDHTMTAICAYAIPVSWYMFGIMKWTRCELRKLDVKARKMLITKRVHHLKGNVYHLYLRRSKGGRGLREMEDTNDCECTALAAYVFKSTDVLTQIVCDTPTPMQKFIFKFVSSPKLTTLKLTDDNHHHCLKEKHLHGKLFKQQEAIPQVDFTKSHQWLCHTNMHPETNAAICTA